MDDGIPKFLMTSGGLSIVLALILGIRILTDESSLGKVFIGFFVVGFFFLFGIQIWGSYVVFRKWSSWNSFYKHNPDIGCDNTTYLFSFSMLIIYWTLGPCIFCTQKD